MRQDFKINVRKVGGQKEAPRQEGSASSLLGPIIAQNFGGASTCAFLDVERRQKAPRLPIVVLHIIGTERSAIGDFEA